jgi:hypothetical protein
MKRGALRAAASVPVDTATCNNNIQAPILHVNPAMHNLQQQCNMHGSSSSALADGGSICQDLLN